MTSLRSGCRPTWERGRPGLHPTRAGLLFKHRRPSRWAQFQFVPNHGEFLYEIRQRRSWIHGLQRVGCRLPVPDRVADEQTHQIRLQTPRHCSTPHGRKQEHACVPAKEIRWHFYRWRTASRTSIYYKTYLQRKTWPDGGTGNCLVSIIFLYDYIRI